LHLPASLPLLTTSPSHPCLPAACLSPIPTPPECLLACLPAHHTLPTTPCTCLSPLPTPQLNWGVDLSEGRAGDPWKNALLSEEAKEVMWGLHSKQG
jgi:hypothetical protein